MSEGQLFRLGADVRCTDGECGKLTSLVVSDSDDIVTHLVVDPVHEQGAGKLVPFGLVDTESAGDASGAIRLSCTVAEFRQLDPAEATYLYPSYADEARPGGSTAAWPSYAPPGVMGAPGLPAEPGPPQEYTVDIVSDKLPGEDEVSRGQQVHATDGDIGHIQGIGVDPATGRVTSVLLKTGHLWNHRVVPIPRSAIDAVGVDGFHLNITAQQVQDLRLVPDAGELLAGAVKLVGPFAGPAEGARRLGAQVGGGGTAGEVDVLAPVHPARIGAV
jgi:hypothetical protein